MSEAAAAWLQTSVVGQQQGRLTVLRVEPFGPDWLDPRTRRYRRYMPPSAHRYTILLNELRRC